MLFIMPAYLTEAYLQVLHLPFSYHHNLTLIPFMQSSYMRVCQGCRGNLKRLGGSAPASPFDLCATRAEHGSFWDSNGILITSQKEQPANYHLNLSCIHAVAPTFVSSSLVVLSDIRPKLNVVHKEYVLAPSF